MNDELRGRPIKAYLSPEGVGGVPLDHLLHVIEQQLPRILLILHHTTAHCIINTGQPVTYHTQPQQAQVDYPPHGEARLPPSLKGLQTVILQ